MTERNYNTHGLKIDMDSLIAASEYTRDVLDPAYLKYVIRYDPHNGAVAAYCIGNGEFFPVSDEITEFTVATGYRFMSPQYILNSIHDALPERQVFLEQAEEGGKIIEEEKKRQAVYRRENDKRWVDSHKEHKRYLNDRSASRRFINSKATLDDIAELESLIAKRKAKLMGEQTSS